MKFHEPIMQQKKHDTSDCEVTSKAVWNAWLSHVKPYYKCWPAVLQSLSKPSLDFRLSDAGLKIRTVALRFAEGHEPSVGKYSCHCIVTMYSRWAVFRSGCVVHSDKMTKVPTGYITPEGVEVET